MSTRKRQKSTPTCEQPLNFSSTDEDSRQCYTLDTLPPEVLEMILRLLSFDEVARIVRLVSRRCLAVATTILNNAFIAAGNKLEAGIKSLEETMHKMKPGPELLACSRAYNALETIAAQYKFLRAVTWRYTYPSERKKSLRLCFYAGSLLDDLHYILRRALIRPSAWIASYKSNLTHISCFVTFCKRFMNYFEKISERKINSSVLVSGCKVVDILDCLMERREMLSFKISSGKNAKDSIVGMQVKYAIQRSWFTCLEVPANNNDETSWRDEQRFMYLRLRRLIGSVNEDLLETFNYKREVLLKIPPLPPPKQPPASTYSGYGEYGGQFFYYGNMNKYAYECKFKSIRPSNLQAETEEETETHCSDLVILVDLRCSMELAPFAVKSILKSDDLEAYNAKIYNRPEFYLKLHITCPTSQVNRLPSNFTWELKGPHRSVSLCQKDNLY